MKHSEIPSNPFKGQKGMGRVVKALFYSRDGLRSAYRHEAAFRQLVWLNGFLLVAVWLFNFDVTVRMVLIFSSFLSLIVELFNTGIEAVVDYISLQTHPLAKRAKDVGSAAQLLAMVLLGIVWLMALCQ